MPRFAVFPFEENKWASQEQVIECFKTSNGDENLRVSYKACLPCIADTILVAEQCAANILYYKKKHSFTKKTQKSFSCRQY